MDYDLDTSEWLALSEQMREAGYDLPDLDPEEELSF